MYLHIYLLDGHYFFNLLSFNELLRNFFNLYHYFDVLHQYLHYDLFVFDQLRHSKMNNLHLNCLWIKLLD